MIDDAAVLAAAGTVLVVGCPAGEIHAPGTATRGGGKALSAAAGVWDGVDAALYAHPEFLDTVSTRSRWLGRERLLVSGSRSLDGAPAIAQVLALATVRLTEHA